MLDVRMAARTFGTERGGRGGSWSHTAPGATGGTSLSETLGP